MKGQPQGELPLYGENLYYWFKLNVVNIKIMSHAIIKKSAYHAPRKIFLERLFSKRF